MRKERLNKLDISLGKTPKRQVAGCCHSQMDQAHAENSDLLNILKSPMELELFLVHVLEPGEFVKEVWEMSNLERFLEAPIVKADGVEFYKKGMIKEACEKFVRALQLLESITISTEITDAERERKQVAEEIKELERKKRVEILRIKREQGVQQTIDDGDSVTAPVESVTLIDTERVFFLMQTCRLNYVACKLKQNDYRTAVSQCTEIINQIKEKGNDYLVYKTKAFFRRSQAYLSIGGDPTFASNDLVECRRILDDRIAKSNNEVEKNGIKAELAEVEVLSRKIDQAIAQQTSKEREMYSKIFN